MNDNDMELSLAMLGDLVDIEIGRREKRPLCERCCRPVGVCWCKSVDSSKVEVKSCIILLQHPHEEKRCLRTAPILENLLPEGHFLELKGKKFSTKRFPQLQDILQSKNTIVLYPGKEAKSINDLPPVSSNQPPYNIILLDGTWQQTKSMFFRNLCLRDLQQAFIKIAYANYVKVNIRQVRSMATSLAANQGLTLMEGTKRAMWSSNAEFCRSFCNSQHAHEVCLSGDHNSQYVIRTQPSEEALSTVETAAITLSTLEDDWTIYERLINPLKVICDFQMNHGAVKHESKEQLILSGRYKKPLGKRTYRKLRKCGVKNANITMQEILDIAEKQNLKEQEKCISLNKIECNKVDIDAEKHCKGRHILKESRPIAKDVKEKAEKNSTLNNFNKLQLQDSNSFLDLGVDVER